MKNIGIDVRMVRNTGIGTYLRGLLEHFKGAEPLKHPIHLFGPADPITNGAFSVQPFRSRIYSINEQIEYPFHLRKCSLWHAPHYNVPVLKGGTKLVVTIHDLIHWIFRKDFFSPLQAAYAGWMLKQASLRSDHIITVSERTKLDLIKYFNADAKKISVIYEGVSSRFKPVQDAAQLEKMKMKYQLPESYFLYVGLIKPHKNVLTLIRLFKQLRKEGLVKSSLVLIGKKDKHYPPGLEELTHLKTGEGIIYLPFVETEELVLLYNGALALVHPSLYEGFGLTLLEAMACGTPVIACRTSSIPEVAGHAAWLVDPSVPGEMKDAMAEMERTPVLRMEYGKKGIVQAGRFRWDDAAKKTLEVYERVLSE